MEKTESISKIRLQLEQSSSIMSIDEINGWIKCNFTKEFLSLDFEFVNQFLEFSRKIQDDIRRINAFRFYFVFFINFTKNNFSRVYSNEEVSGDFHLGHHQMVIDYYKTLGKVNSEETQKIFLESEMLKLSYLQKKKEICIEYNKENDSIANYSFQSFMREFFEIFSEYFAQMNSKTRIKLILDFALSIFNFLDQNSCEEPDVFFFLYRFVFSVLRTSDVETWPNAKKRLKNLDEILILILPKIAQAKQFQSFFEFGKLEDVNTSGSYVILKSLLTLVVQNSSRSYLPDLLKSLYSHVMVFRGSLIGSSVNFLLFMKVLELNLTNRFLIQRFEEFDFTSIESKYL